MENPLGIYLSKLASYAGKSGRNRKIRTCYLFFDGEYNGTIENCAKVLVPSLKVKNI